MTLFPVETPFPRGKVVVCQYDLDFNLTYVNPAFAEMAGYAREELLGLAVGRIVHPDVPPELIADIRQTTAQGRPWRGMAKTLRRDGGYVWSDSLIIPVLRQGQITGYMAIRSEASPQRIAAEEQRYRDIRSGACRYQSAMRQRWSGVTAFHLLAVLGVSASVLAAEVVMLVLAPQAVASYLPLCLALAALAWGATVGSARWLGQRTLRGLHDIVQCFRRMAEGDLSREIPVGGEDEVGHVQESLGVMQGHLQVLLDEIRTAAMLTEQENGQLRQQIAQLSQSAASQQAGMLTVHAATTDNAEVVAGVASAAHTAAEAAEGSLSLIQQGCQQLDTAAAAARQAALAVDDSTEALAQLTQSIGEVDSMAQLIRDIADQTNLLALNAAIEAARAGEQGRGFAVVADEVRRLAESTTGSTQGIGQRLQEIRQVTQRTRQAMQAAARHAHLAHTTVQPGRDIMQAIAGRSQQVAEQAQHIAQACQAQVQSAAAVTGEVTGLSQQVAGNQACLHAVEHGVAAVQAQVTGLAERVGRFRVVVLR